MRSDLAGATTLLPNTEFSISSMSVYEPSISQVSFIASSQRIRCSHTVRLYSQKTRVVRSSPRF